MTTKLLAIFILIVHIGINSIGSAQRYVGALDGYGKSIFMHLRNQDDYKIISSFGNAALFSVFHEQVVDSATNFRVSAQYEFQQMFYATKHYSKFGLTSANEEYRRQQLGINLEYLFRLNKKPKRWTSSFVVGLVVAYNLRTSVSSHGSQLVQHTFTDPNGNQQHSFVNEDYQTTDKHSKKLAQLTIGVNVGMEFSFALNERSSLLIQNKYGLSIFTGVLTGYISIGLRRQMGK